MSSKPLGCGWPTARSGGGAAGGVTGARSHPPQGPASSVATAVATDQRVTSVSPRLRFAR
jgi:hypothetical protein